MSHTGGCLCGAIRYEFAKDPVSYGVCHCLNCQRQGGSAFSTIAPVAKADFIIRGKPKLYTDSKTRSGKSVKRYFCGSCGSPIYSELYDQPDIVILKTGTMDDTSAFTPMFHAWCSSKQDWVELADGVPQRETQSEQ